MNRNHVLSQAVDARFYESKLKDWYERSSIRTSPRRLLLKEDAEGKVYFPPDLVPIIGHQLVRGQGQDVAQRLIVQHLYAYLDFTAALEHDVVNRVTQRIAQQRAGFELPQAMVMDAYKIYCDEAYHALFSADIREQIHAATTVAPLEAGRQVVLGPRLAVFVRVFLEPDRAAVRGHLLRSGLSREQADQVIAETYPQDQVLASVRRAARATLRLFERQGIFEDPATRAAFQATGLLG